MAQGGKCPPDQLPQVWWEVAVVSRPLPSTGPANDGSLRHNRHGSRSRLPSAAGHGGWARVAPPEPMAGGESCASLSITLLMIDYTTHGGSSAEKEPMCFTGVSPHPLYVM